MGFTKPIEQYLFCNLLTKIHVFMYIKDIIRGENKMEELLFNLSFDIVKCIQEERYDDLEMQGCLKKTSKEYLKNVLDDYGGVLDIVQKEEYLKSFQYIKINNQDIFKTYLDLMIDGERSDLTIICEIETDDCGNVKIAIEDLHVL
ncbi:Uncharacterised protein [uncultured Eubacterium sp.]|jgi:hypothetical protein|nr:Uncharacterised protein [uncultured Eubacterium sp.]